MPVSATRDNTRRLRRSMTDAERVIWHHLRNRAFGNAKFRRQHPIGPYIADFACVACRLVVEIDGAQHVGSAQDRFRTAALEARGWRVLRVWNHDVLQLREAVLDAIDRAVRAARSSDC